MSLHRSSASLALYPSRSLILLSYEQSGYEASASCSHSFQQGFFQFFAQGGGEQVWICMPPDPPSLLPREILFFWPFISHNLVESGIFFAQA